MQSGGKPSGAAQKKPQQKQQQQQKKNTKGDAQAASNDQDELHSLEVEVSPEQMLKAQWIFSSNGTAKTGKATGKKADKK